MKPSLLETFSQTQLVEMVIGHVKRTIRKGTRANV